MTIDKLKAGYLVQLNNGDIKMVCLSQEDKVSFVSKPDIIGHSKWLDSADYRMDMTNERDEFTVIKVYGRAKFEHLHFDFTGYGRDVLWERYKKTKKKYTYAQLREILGAEFEVVW